MPKQQIIGLISVGLAVVALNGGPALAEPPQADQTTTQQMIDALEGAFGNHPGSRKNHAKGMCVCHRHQWHLAMDARTKSRAAIDLTKPCERCQRRPT